MKIKLIEEDKIKKTRSKLSWKEQGFNSAQKKALQEMKKIAKDMKSDPRAFARKADEF